MSDEIEGSRSHLIELTAEIVSAYVGNNAVPVASLPDLIESVNSSLDEDQTADQPGEAGSGARGQSETVFVSRLHHLP